MLSYSSSHTSKLLTFFGIEKSLCLCDYELHGKEHFLQCYVFLYLKYFISPQQHNVHCSLLNDCIIIMCFMVFAGGTNHVQIHAHYLKKLKGVFKLYINKFLKATVIGLHCPCHHLVETLWSLQFYKLVVYADSSVVFNIQ